MTRADSYEVALREIANAYSVSRGGAQEAWEKGIFALGLSTATGEKA